MPLIQKKVFELQNRDPNVESNKDALQSWIKIIASTYWPTLLCQSPKLQELAERAEKHYKAYIEKGVKELGSSINIDVARLIAIDELWGAHRANLCVVKNERFSLFKPRQPLFEEARRYYSWHGTLISATLGNIFTGLANPNNEFIIYAPGRRVTLHRNFEVFIGKHEYQ